MSPASAPQILSIEATLAAAQRIVAQPSRQTQRVAADEVFSLATLALQLQEVAILAAHTVDPAPVFPLPEASADAGGDHDARLWVRLVAHGYCTETDPPTDEESPHA